MVRSCLTLSDPCRQGSRRMGKDAQVWGRRSERMRSEDGGAGEKGGVVGMNDGGARFSVSDSSAGMNGWSGFRENAAQRVLRAQNAVFPPFFLYFSRFATRRASAEGAGLLVGDEAMIRIRSPRLRDIILRHTRDRLLAGKTTQPGGECLKFLFFLLQRLFPFVLYA